MLPCLRSLALAGKFRMTGHLIKAFFWLMPDFGHGGECKMMQTLFTILIKSPGIGDHLGFVFRVCSSAR